MTVILKRPLCDWMATDWWHVATDWWHDHCK